MASVIRQLNDADLEEVHHMIRRDAKTDLEIAREVESRLGSPIGDNDHAREMVVHRYRKSKTYQRWIERCLSQHVEMEKQVRLAKQRYEMAMSLLDKDAGFNAIDLISEQLQARVLTLAMEAPDSDLIEAMQGRGWLKNLLRIIQEQQKLTIKRVADQVLETSENNNLSRDAQNARLREIFGRE